jgi:hypothetical protein
MPFYACDNDRCPRHADVVEILYSASGRPTCRGCECELVPVESAPDKTPAENA